MVAMTSLIRSTGMSPTTRGLLFSSWGRGSEGLRFSPAAEEEKKQQNPALSLPASRPWAPCWQHKFKAVYSVALVCFSEVEPHV